MLTEAMQITSTGPQTIQKAQGETVQLGCTYAADSGDTGDLDIEWSNVRPDMTQKDILVCCVCLMTERKDIKRTQNNTKPVCAVWKDDISVQEWK